MSKIVLSSMFRNSVGYLPRYFAQAHELREALRAQGHRLELVLAEGDSDDGTWFAIVKEAASFHLNLVKREHGGKHAWHSVDIPERWKAISWVCNGILDNVPRDADAFIYVESDLAWRADTMLGLLSQLNRQHPAIAAMCFTAVNDFYDIWGHIGMDMVNFSPFPPYHSSLNGGLTEVYSAGSCFAMLGDVVRSGVRFDSNDHVRGLGRSIREKGFSLWVDPTLRVVHL